MVVVWERSNRAKRSGASCLKLVEEAVDGRGAEVMTKHVKSVVRIVPRDSARVRLCGALKGTVKIIGDIVGSTGERWNADRQGRLTRAEIRLRSRRKPASKP